VWCQKLCGAKTYQLFAPKPQAENLCPKALVPPMTTARGFGITPTTGRHWFGSCIRPANNPRVSRHKTTLLSLPLNLALSPQLCPHENIYQLKILLSRCPARLPCCQDNHAMYLCFTLFLRLDLRKTASRHPAVFVRTCHALVPSISPTTTPLQPYPYMCPSLLTPTHWRCTPFPPPCPSRRNKPLHQCSQN
jgi:hypothetical protein